MDHGESKISSAEERGYHEHAPPMRLPLTWKQLKAGHVRQLALALDVHVPTTASTDKLHQMIDGRLAEGCKETRNIQVVLERADSTSNFPLEDEEGTDCPCKRGGDPQQIP